MRWLPRFRLTETIMCFDDGEAEGPVLLVTWGAFIVEIAVARRTRTLAGSRHLASKIIAGGAEPTFRFKTKND